MVQVDGLLTEFLTEEELKSLLHTLPPAEFAFAYGSGAMRQEVSALMLSLHAESLCLACTLLY